MRRLLALLVLAACVLPVAAGSAAPRFVSLHDVAPGVRLDMRYHGPHNFVGRRIAGYRAPVCVLTRQAARALARVQRAVRARGYTLKAYDCYRPQRAVDDFVRWARDLGDQRMKAEFYPRVDKRRLFADGYIAERSGHSRGSTVDLTLVKLPARRQARYRPGQRLVDCAKPAGVRFGDDSIDMGTGYDCFDPLAHTLSPRVRGRARANRLLLKGAMDRAGFENYANEWWHYTLRDEPYPERAWNFPVQRGALP